MHIYPSLSLSLDLSLTLFGSYIPDDDNMYKALWGLSSSANDFQSMLAIFVFSIWFKLLKFTHNIPVMNRIGDTFSVAMFDVSMFAVVMFVMFVAFSMAFNITFCTALDEYGRFSISLFSIFRALVGDIDGSTLFTAAPVLGPLLYAAFLFVVLFVGFTILIAIISAAYERTKEHTVKDGLINTGYDYVMQNIPTKPAEEEDATAHSLQLLTQAMLELTDKMSVIDEKLSKLSELQGLPTNQMAPAGPKSKRVPLSQLTRASRDSEAHVESEILTDASVVQSNGKNDGRERPANTVTTLRL